MNILCGSLRLKIFRNAGGVGVDGGSLRRMSILRNGNVALSNVAMLILRECHLACVAKA